MKPRSFRLRLALISAISAAIGLFVFGLVVSSLWWKDRIKRVDEELSRQGHVLASRNNLPSKMWEEVYNNMQSILGEEQITSRFIGVHRSQGEMVYTSSNWPENLDLTEYPASSETFEWRGSARDFFRPKGPNSRRREQGMGPGNDPRPRREIFSRRTTPPSRTLKQARFYDFTTRNQQRWRVAVFGNTKNDVVLGAHLGELQSELRSLWVTFGTASTGALSLIALGAWLLSRKALTPIEALTEATRQVSASDLSQRIELANADREFLPLINVYNGMMERLEKSFHQATRFSADASHELKTPVAIMKGTLERALADAPPGSKEQSVYTSLLEETEHQQAILQSLLLLSRADAGKLHITMDPVSLSDLMTDVLDDAEMMAEDMELSVRSEIAPDVMVDGDPNLLQQILHNLLTNASKYNHRQGWLQLSLAAEGTEAVLSVSNSGEGIPPEAQDRLFERFYRVEASRSNRKDGIGLGLSLSLELIKAHGGNLALLKSTTEETVFEVRLPMSKA